ncbi:hypothetical protein H072_694 [Dactylellina haptotyla CBS 200.50]|uniref:WSC domain-containing protein n=1 Tax=Dactylellina haptotyla (strain CBS 200.50) TaxID=1284197 RepID=S8AWF8_DACHA|nr:hypothetical protein H072_694 [Dactylellina haptotyla CBS 200.50]
MQLGTVAFTAALFASAAVAVPSQNMGLSKRMPGANFLSKRGYGDGTTYGNWDNCYKKVTPFELQGCYALAPGAPGILEYGVLPQWIASSQMTKSKCYQRCKGLGVRYAAFLNGGICACGNQLKGNKIDSSKCTSTCNADGAKDCGGPTVYSVYADPTIKADYDVTTAVTGYQYSGCYWDDPERIVRFGCPDPQLTGTVVTITKCFAACAKYGYPFAGLTAGEQCAIRPGAKDAGPITCNMPCKADKGDICGGWWAQAVYYNPDLDSSEPCR